jgi:hypothetical protein
VEVRLDNEPWEVAEGMTVWTHELDISALAEGYHTIRVRASSMDSTSELVMVNFTLGKVAPDTQLTLREWLLTWEGIVTVFAVAIVANLIVFGARRARATRTRT